MVRTIFISGMLGVLSVISASAKGTRQDFTEREKNVVAVPTKGLFDESDKIVVDFSKISRKDWCYPMKNGRVISPFGGKRKNHKGTDIKTFANDTIYAAFDGRVRFAKSFAGYGNAIVLRHDIGIETLYSHNKKNLVRIGDYVKAGQPIAIVGRTGRATTEHCHFEVRINGKPYDPMRFFDSKTRQLRSISVVAHKSGRIETVNVVPEYDMAEDKTVSPKDGKKRG